MTKKKKPVIQRIEELKKNGKQGTEIAKVLRREGYALSDIQSGFLVKGYGAGTIRLPAGEARLYVSDQPLPSGKQYPVVLDPTGLPFLVWAKASAKEKESPVVETDYSAVGFAYGKRELMVRFKKDPRLPATSALCQICKKRRGLRERFTITELVDGNTTEVLPLTGRTAAVIRKVLKAHEYVICGSWRCIEEQHQRIEQALTEQGEKRGRKG